MPGTIAPRALKSLMEGEEPFSLLDVREPGEYQRRQIFTATSLPRSQIESRLRQLVPVKDTKVVLYDEGGPRAALAAATLERAGYARVLLLEGGLPAWEAAGLPAVSGTNVPSKDFGERVHQEKRVPEVTPQELSDLLTRGEDVLVLDARTPEEFSRFCIPGGLSVPGGELILHAHDLARDPQRAVVVNCAGRTRSIIGTEALRRLGLANVRELKNGCMGWALAGLGLERGAEGRARVPSPESRRAAEALAAKLAGEEGIVLISPQELQGLQARAERETLYLLDVRSNAEYAGGHVPGAISIPGGQAVQRADEVVAVGSAHIVLACDACARATMVAHWYRQMGFPRVYVLRGGTAAWAEAGLPLGRGPGFPSPQGPESAWLVEPPMGLDAARAKVRLLSPQEVKARLGGGGAPLLLLHVGTSPQFREAHLPGAQWLPRGWLEMRIAAFAPDHDTPLLLTCRDGLNSAFAGATLRELGYREVSVLEGGMEAWGAAGFPAESGLQGVEGEPGDVALKPYEVGREAMAAYLAWEEGLGNKYGGGRGARS